jgi:hypothetical protein
MSRAASGWKLEKTIGLSFAYLSTTYKELESIEKNLEHQQDICCFHSFSFNLLTFVNNIHVMKKMNRENKRKIS